MLPKHAFLIAPQKWLGEGKINLSMVEEELNLYTRWTLGHKNDAGEIEAEQEVEIQGMGDIMLNKFRIYDFTKDKFTIELENASLGIIKGSGVIKDKVIAWEFRDSAIGFEGYEFYELQDDGSYLMRAEYSTPDHLRTTIQGRIWERAEK